MPRCSHVLAFFVLAAALAPRLWAQQAHQEPPRVVPQEQREALTPDTSIAAEEPAENLGSVSSTTLSMDFADMPCARVPRPLAPAQVVRVAVERKVDDKEQKRQRRENVKTADGIPAVRTTEVLRTESRVHTRITTVTAMATITSQTYGALEPPDVFVEREVRRVIELVESPEYRVADRQAALRSQAHAILVEMTEPQVLGALVLARYRERLSTEQWRIFLAHLSRLFFSSFIVSLEDHRGSQFAVIETLRPSPLRARVVAQLVSAREEVPLSFRLAARPDRWVLYDIHIRNVSLMRNYRKQFREILLDQPAETLLERLKLAIERDPIASAGKPVAPRPALPPEALPAFEADIQQPAAAPQPEGKVVEERLLGQDTQITTGAALCTITTTNTWGVLTTLTISTVYTTLTQTIDFLTVTERILDTEQEVTLPRDAIGVVRVTVDRVLAYLSKPDYDEPGKPAYYRQKVRDAMVQAVNMDLVGQLTLSRYYRKFEQEEFEDFKTAFSELLFGNYIEHLEKYTDEKFIIDGVKELTDTKAQVHTRTVTRTKEIPIDFSMALIDSQWYIYDLRIEGISLVKNFRTQFRDILMRGTPRELIDKIKDKVKSNAEQTN